MAQQYQPAYYQPPTKQGNGFGVTALVVGIFAVILAVIPLLGFTSFILGPIAVIFGLIGLAQANRPKGMSVVGIILGVTSLIIAVAVTSAFFSAFSSAAEGDVTVSQPTDAAPPAGSPSPDAAPDAMVVEATQLLQDFDDNEAAADVKYSGKILEVTGNVHKVDTEILDDTKYVVRLNDGGEYSFATVDCNDIPTEQAVAAIAGSTVTIRGAFDDGGNLGVDLADCVVL